MTFEKDSFVALPRGSCQSCNVRGVEVRVRFEESDDEYAEVFWLCRECSAAADGMRHGAIKEALVQLSDWG